MENEIEDSMLKFLKNNHDKRKEFFEKFIRICEPDDILYLMNRLDDFKKDFFVLLPGEILHIILEFLDWQSLLTCCLVSKEWNDKISNQYNKIWYNLCKKHLPLNIIADSEYQPNEINYKHKFVDILKNSVRQDNGKLFSSTQFGPVEIEALATYKNLIATASRVAKFWKYDEKKKCMGR